MKHILLIIGGGIAAYKSLEIARQLKKKGYDIIPVMTASAEAFVTKLSVEALCGNEVHSELFAPGQESKINHIALARMADAILVCPATANLLARMAHGLADDLATTILLAAKAPIFVAPAMNVRMWEHPATQANIALLKQRDVHFIGPAEGEMACGDYGLGRLSPIEDIICVLEGHLKLPAPLLNKHFLVTAGPTCEPIDPVRYISNHSSGLQGYAIAEALAQLGAKVTLVSGPVSLATPLHVDRVNVVTAREMLDQCLKALPADGMVAVAAVSDWRAEQEHSEKFKKGHQDLTKLKLVENPDILATICRHQKRPALVVGFAAETENVLDYAREKRERKGCDWLIANDVKAGVFGSDRNQVSILDGHAIETWPMQTKKEVAARLAQKISTYFSQL
ncbi:bifunctional phosphopantothenoylcysteine decarboxylase/phosphopantothenate--cysteine ligase CoaBC [Aristophania vespae]|uniref:bifunctional phosphopantothenoylcysteine decarboxylase/phosphopantothenate--cysteine ligase CoaBC n=1 Tax=Aristophania vespae TaxID=2697033 RepID=UPI002351772B|nr:bifunctional phosphopantothenoylcysteine decarboxylase/phosphopantothenate--cysteine ligase CoaBC [Aristophania vespae]UMM63229.1 Coenzyme A biosynthesis bifunctional protein CoaBC [Aristophania vespae]